MANLNDFKLVNIKSRKMFSYIKNVQKSDLKDIQKSRMGFYHLVLENVTGIRDAEDVTKMIIDTDYNKILYGKTYNDLGIDAINYIGEDDEQEITVQLFNFKFRENFKVDKNMEEASVNGSIKFLEYICAGEETQIEQLPDDIVKEHVKKIYDYLNSNRLCNIELYMVSNENKTFTEDADKYLGLLQNHFGIRIKAIALDDVIGYFDMKKESSPCKFIISPNDFLVFQQNELSTQKSYVVKVSLLDLIRITCNDTELKIAYDNEDDRKLVNVKLDYTLLYDNVRGYLGETIYNVNIQKTLKNNNKEFFMLNNGITVTAKKINVDEVNSGKRFLFFIDDYQIVNGGQTIRSIYEFFENEKGNVDVLHNLSETYVLLRFFKISEEESLKNRIAEYTNSQNAISSADLKSVDSIQIQIEKYFKEEKILYARKAGVVGEDDVEYECRISKEKLAQILYSAKGYPDRASNQKKRLFQEYYEDIFAEDFNVEKAVKLVRLYYEIEKTFDEIEENFKAYEQKYFYILFIVHKYNKEIIEAIRILEDLISCECTEITESRMLLKNKFKERLIAKLEEKKEYTFFDLFAGVGEFADWNF